MHFDSIRVDSSRFACLLAAFALLFFSVPLWPFRCPFRCCFCLVAADAEPNAQANQIESTRLDSPHSRTHARALSLRAAVSCLCACCDVGFECAHSPAGGWIRCRIGLSCSCSCHSYSAPSDSLSTSTSTSLSGHTNGDNTSRTTNTSYTAAAIRSTARSGGGDRRSHRTGSPGERRGWI